MDYFIGQLSDEADILILDAEEAHHCIRVARHKAGDMIRVTDGRGHLWEGEVLPHPKHPDFLSVKIISAHHETHEGACPMVLLVSPPQHPDRMEWLIEKAVELGVTHIVLTGTERRILGKLKWERIFKIVRSACKQSGRSRFPSVQAYDDVISAVESIKQLNVKGILGAQEGCSLVNVNVNIDMRLESIAIAIGPEGDFTDSEKNHLKNQGFTEASLGKLRLRTETAAIALLAYFSAIRT
jgi:16S rRNA (uracil1498-N3)-methyltransferase